MDTNQIIEDLDVIFRDVLENDNIKLTPNTSAADIEEWDSLNYIQLVVAIEKKYKIKFSTTEILKWRNIGEMIESIQKKGV